MTAGDIFTVAGDGESNYAGDGGPATSAALYEPASVGVDLSGNLGVADTLNNRIRVVAATTGALFGQAMTAGDIYTVAGNGTRPFGGDGGPATSAGLKIPRGVAFDGSGNLVIADTGHNRIRVVAATTGTFYGQAMTAGDIYTVAGTGTAGFAGNGTRATKAELKQPREVAVDSSGNLVIADTLNDRIRVIAATTGTFYGQAMTAGRIYTAAGGGAAQGNGARATQTMVDAPEGVAVDGSGNLVIADTLHGRIRVVAATTGTFYGQAMTAGDIYTVAGSGSSGPAAGDGRLATKAVLDQPDGVAVDGSGNLVFADTLNNRIRVVAATTGTFYGQAMTAEHIYTVTAALGEPEDVAIDSSGNLVIADTLNNRVSEMSSS